MVRTQGVGRRSVGSPGESGYYNESTTSLTGRDVPRYIEDTGGISEMDLSLSGTPWESTTGVWKEKNED